jgi:hypothetical protein
MDEQIYIQENGGTALGPYTKSRIEELYRSGKLSARSPVSTDLTGPWTSVGLLLSLHNNNNTNNKSTEHNNNNNSAITSNDMTLSPSGNSNKYSTSTSKQQPTTGRSMFSSNTANNMSYSVGGTSSSYTDDNISSLLAGGNNNGITMIRNTSEDATESHSPSNQHLPRRASLVMARARLKSIGSTLQNKLGRGTSSSSLIGGGGSKSSGGGGGGGTSSNNNNNSSRVLDSISENDSFSMTGSGSRGGKQQYPSPSQSFSVPGTSRRFSNLSNPPITGGAGINNTTDELSQRNTLLSTDDMETLLANNIRDLAHDFSLVMERLETLQFVASKIGTTSSDHSPTLQSNTTTTTTTNNNDYITSLQRENEILKSFCRSIHSVVSEHAPELLPENVDVLFTTTTTTAAANIGNNNQPGENVNSSSPTMDDPTYSSPRLVPVITSTSNNQNQSTATNITNHNTAQQAFKPLSLDKHPSFTTPLLLPFESDSPMLRDRMDLAEASLDEVRQSIKQCTKSCLGFLNSAAAHVDSGLSFSEDLLRSPIVEFKQLGELFSIKLAARAALLQSIEGTFINPLSKFANNELKSIQYARQDLDRKRDIFENLEAKVMAHIRKGKDHKKNTSNMNLTSTSMATNSSGGSSRFDGSTSITSSYSSNANNNTANSIMSSSSNNYTNYDENVDKILLELRSAEANFELSRCAMIRLLNQLNVKQTVLIQTSVGKVAESFATYYQTQAPKAVHLATRLDKTRQISLVENTVLERRIENEFEERCLAIESYRTSSFTGNSNNSSSSNNVLTIKRPFPTRRMDCEPDLDHEGWLMKRSSNVIKDWKKRFFQLKGGALFYYRGSVPTHVADVILCTVRTSSNKMAMVTGNTNNNNTSSSANSGSSFNSSNSNDFSFEVISNKRSFLLQASSEEDKEAWVNAIRRAVERELGGGGGGSNNIVSGNQNSNHKNSSFEWSMFSSNNNQPTIITTTATTNNRDEGDEPIVSLGTSPLPTTTSSSVVVSDLIIPSISPAGTSGNEIILVDANRQCCDCHGDLGEVPNWVSISLGSFICMNCSGAHRALGTHLSKVKSLRLDTLSPSQIDILKRFGNSANAKIWEAKMETANIARNTLTCTEFVKEKYQNKSFVDTLVSSSSTTTLGGIDDVVLAAEKDDIFRLAYLNAHGVSFSLPGNNSSNNNSSSNDFLIPYKTTPLHAVAKYGGSASTCEFILLNGGSMLDALDEDGKTPLEVARAVKNVGVEQVLLNWLSTSSSSLLSSVGSSSNGWSNNNNNSMNQKGNSINNHSNNYVIGKVGIILNPSEVLGAEDL